MHGKAYVMMVNRISLFCGMLIYNTIIIIVASLLHYSMLDTWLK